MSAEIYLQGTPGATYAAVLRNSSGEVWDGGDFAAWDDDDLAGYALPLTEQGASGYATAGFPAAITDAGRYPWTIYDQAGASLALTDTPVAVGETLWGGATELLPLAVYGEDGPAVFTYTVYEEDGTTPLPGAAVYVSADAEGMQRSQTRISDDLGRVIFNLNPGPAYFWRSHRDWDFDDPDTETVG